MHSDQHDVWQGDDVAAYVPNLDGLPVDDAGEPVDADAMHAFPNDDIVEVTR